MDTRPGAGRTSACLAGLLAAATALSASALADAVSPSVPSLVSVVDQRIIRAVPGLVSRAAVEAVGKGDKPLLVAATVGIILALGVALGLVAARRPAAGPVLFVALGAALPVACAASLDGVPVLGAGVGAAVAVIAGISTLHLLLAAATMRCRPTVAAPLGVPDRRLFLVGSAAAAWGAASSFVAARHLGAPGVATVQRAGVRLPAPVPGRPGATGPDLPAVDGLSRLVTANADFFRIDEALVVPSVDVRTWRLRVTGMVGAPFELSLDELLARPQVERVVTVACVSNEVGGRLVGTARWSGVLLADLLSEASIHPDASQVVGRSVDGFTAGFPVEAAVDGRQALVALGMNGEPLPLEHGFPARLVVPGLYGFVSATKWLREVELTTWAAFDAYWVERNWAERAPIKVQSRVDVPRDFSRARAGTATAAGVAWAPRSGIAAVEVRVDGGPWRAARLGPSLGRDAWRQWVHEWRAEIGQHVLEVRAITEDGVVQSETKHGSFPDGATGLHEVHVRVVA